MIRAVVWKELREQGLIGLTLVVLGSGVLVLAATLADPPTAGAAPTDVIRRLGVGLLATMMLAVTAGMVCGGAVFAAEREAGTMGFLDALPATRWRLWVAKLVAGLGLAAAQISLLLVAAATLGLVTTFGWARAVAVFSLLAFAWGVFGSTVSRTTLGAVGAAIPAATVTAVVALLPVAFVARQPNTLSVRQTEAAFFLGCMFLVPVALSAWVFTTPDRLRAAEDASAADAGEGLTRVRAGSRAVVWLAVRQLRVTGLVLAAFALLFGLSLLAPGTQPVVSWPALALAAGVLTGVTAFADEQTRGVARFWGEQRLPLDRLWLSRVGLALLMCLGLLLVLAAPMLVRSQFMDRNFSGHPVVVRMFRSRLMAELGSQWWMYLLVPAAYGFAAGHLCGLLFRKLVVACGVAAIVGGVGAVAWGPSLLSGGVNQWQLWLPPALALLTARSLIPAWSAERLLARGPLTRLAWGGLATAVVMAAGLAYRVLEVPGRPDGEADLAHIAALPPYDSNLGGNAFRTAAERYSRTATLTSQEFERPANAPNPQGRPPRIEDRLARVLVAGWPDADLELGAWLDRVFTPRPEPNTDPWTVALAEAERHPPGIFEHPQLTSTPGTSNARDSVLMTGQRMAVALLARGLQDQAHGNPEPFVKAFRTAVALARTMRNGSTVKAFEISCAIEQSALTALDTWLDRLPPPQTLALRAVYPPLSAALVARFERPDLCRDLTAVLTASDVAGAFDPAPHFLADRYLMREMLKSPAAWLWQAAPAQRPAPDAANPETDLVSLAWAVPWERERTRRLVGLGFETGPPAEYHLVVGRPGLARSFLTHRVPSEVIEIERDLRGARRAAILKLALRAYRAEHDGYPDDARPDPLAVLVEGGYLHHVPADPHDDARPFRYRLSPPAGETLRPRVGGAGDRPQAGANAPSRFVPPGQAILWTVGADRVDQGGTLSPAAVAGNLPRQDDLVYLVPVGSNP